MSTDKVIYSLSQPLAHQLRALGQLLHPLLWRACLYKLRYILSNVKLWCSADQQAKMCPATVAALTCQIHLASLLQSHSIVPKPAGFLKGSANCTFPPHRRKPCFIGSSG